MVVSEVVGPGFSNAVIARQLLEPHCHSRSIDQPRPTANVKSINRLSLRRVWRYDMLLSPVASIDVLFE